MANLKTVVRTALVVLALGGLTAGTFAALQPSVLVEASSSGRPGHQDVG
jgi:hypothetical protein